MRGGSLCDEDGPCAEYAITRPGEGVEERLKQAGVPNKDKALVVLHMRTCWADAGGGRDGADWAPPTLECADLMKEAQYQAHEAVDLVVRYTDDRSKQFLTFYDILDKISASADSAFGNGNWYFYIASDSPNVKLQATRHLGNKGVDVTTASGKVSFSNIRPKYLARSGLVKEGLDEKDHILEVGSTSMSDFVAVSDADMLVYFSGSNFPKAAMQRTLCPQRRYELAQGKRRVRDRVLDMTRILAPAMEAFPNLNEDQETTLAEAIDAIPDGTCDKHKEPLRACACLFKAGLDGPSGIDLTPEHVEEAAKGRMVHTEL